MTKKEIKAEAILRGYEGATVNSLGGSCNEVVAPASKWFFVDGNSLRSGPNCMIYSCNHKTWATITVPVKNKPLPIFN